ncbi:10294_t:CDS:1, partial [Cetraspora pellucida]
MPLVEQPVGESPNLMSDERVKQIELWLENTKTYNLSGTFNRLHRDMTQLMTDRTYFVETLDEIDSKVDNLLEQNTEFENIIKDSLELCIKILKNLEIEGEPD